MKKIKLQFAGSCITTLVATSPVFADETAPLIWNTTDNIVAHADNSGFPHVTSEVMPFIKEGTNNDSISK